MTGIYIIQNSKNKKIYIGSAININKRWACHISLLKNNKHNNKHLQLSWNKYGFENFNFRIIEYCEKEILLEREQYYLNLYLKANEFPKNNFFIKKGYNLNPVSTSRYNSKQSKESIKKSIENNPNVKKVYCLNIAQNEIKKFDSITQCARYYDISFSCIKKSILKNQTLKINTNLIFSHFPTFNNYSIFKPWNKSIKTNIKTNLKKIYIFDIYGNYIKSFESIIDASKNLNIKSSSICKSLKNKNVKSLSGRKYLFSYTLDDIDIKKIKKENLIFIEKLSKNKSKIEVLDLYGNIKGYYLGNITSQIIAVLNNNRKQYKGYIYRYNDIV